MRNANDAKNGLETLGDKIIITQSRTDGSYVQVKITADQVDALVTWLHKAKDLVELGRGGGVRFSS
jgi:hypothetical protein